MPLVLGLTGLASSGKSEASIYLVKKYKFTKFVFSDILREEAEKRKLLKNKSYEEQKEVLSTLGNELRKETGKWGIVAEKLIEKIKLGKFERIVVDGFRSVEEVNLFKENFGTFYLILIHVDEKIRFLRRKLEDPKIKIEDIRERDERDIKELGLGKVIAIADFKVDNSGSLEDLHKQLDKILKKINY